MAETEFHRAIALEKQLVAELSHDRHYRGNLALSHYELGILLRDWGKLERAEAEFRATIDLERKLVAEFPGDRDYRSSLVHSRRNLADLLIKMGQPGQVMVEYREAIDLSKKLADDFPALPEYRHELALSHQSLATFLVSRGELKRADAEIRAALPMRKQLVKEHPKVADYRQNLASCYVFLGNLRAAGKDWAQAETEFRAALPHQQQVVAENQDRVDYATELAKIFINLGSAVGSDGHLKDSSDWYDRAIALLAPLLKKEPENAKVREALFNTHVGRAMNFEDLKNYPDAVKDRVIALELAPAAEKTNYQVRLMICRARAEQFEAALKEADQLAKSNSDGIVYDCACAYGLAHAKTKDDKQAVRAVELLRQAIAKGFRDAANLKADTDLDSLRARVSTRMMR